MNKFNIIAYSLILILTILNFDFSNFTDFEPTRSIVLNILLMLVCVIGIIYHLKNRKEKTQA